MKRRELILMIGGTSAGGLMLETGAFSRLATKRGVSVDVVSDHEALVEYDISNPEIVVTAGESEKRTLVTVTNNLGEDIEITKVEVATKGNGEPTVDNLDWKKEPFESEREIQGKIVCNDPGINTIKSSYIGLTITLEGVDDGGVTMTLSGDTDTRRFIAKCEPKAEPSPTPD